MLKLLILISLSSIVSRSFVNSQSNGGWNAYTAHQDMTALILRDGEIWAASRGGILRYQLESSQIILLNHLDGLSENNIKVMTTDGNTTVLGFGSGALNFQYSAQANWTAVNDLGTLELSSLQIHNNRLYIASNIGLSTYDLVSRVFMDQVEKFGSFTNSALNDVFVFDGRIWVASNEGFASVPISSTNIQAPSQWTNYPSNVSPNMFAAFGGSIFSSTSEGVSRYNDSTSSWETYSSGLPTMSYKIIASNQKLYTYSSKEIFGLESGSWQLISSDIEDSSGNTIEVETFLVDQNDRLWAGSANSGLFYKDATVTEWQVVVSNTPPCNEYNEIVVDLSGNVWVATKGCSRSGLGRLNPQGIWLDFTGFKPELINFEFWQLALDLSGKLWLGNWGQGAASVDIGSGSVYFLNADNGLTGFDLGTSSSPDYVVVTDLIVDSHNSIWISLYFAFIPDRAVCVYDQSSTSFVYYSSQEIGSSQPTVLFEDRFGRIWIGSGAILPEGANGVRVIDNNGTPSDKSDDLITQPAALSQLNGVGVRCFEEDRSGILWIGTDQGLFSFDGLTSEEQINPDGPRGNVINDLFLDKSANLWVATNNGVSVLTRFGEWVHYNTSNSGLIDDNITAIGYNMLNNVLYFGSVNKGLSSFENPFLSGGTISSNIGAYPNPYILNRDEFVTFTNVPADAQVSIISLDGRLIRTLTSDQFQGELRWNGRDDKQEKVASGIYIYYVSTLPGSLVSFSGKGGKIAVIRE